MSDENSRDEHGLQENREPVPQPHQPVGGSNPIVRKEGDAVDLISLRIQQIESSDLPKDVRDQLKADALKRLNENDDRFTKIKQDVNALGASLGTMSQSGADMAEAGMTMTVTKTQDDNLGRTEVIVGNSEAAQRGKLTRSQTSGMGDLSSSTLILIGLIIVAVTIIAVAFASGGV